MFLPFEQNLPKEDGETERLSCLPEMLNYNSNLGGNGAWANNSWANNSHSVYLAIKWSWSSQMRTFCPPSWYLTSWETLND